MNMHNSDNNNNNNEILFWKIFKSKSIVKKIFSFINNNNNNNNNNKDNSLIKWDHIRSVELLLNDNKINILKEKVKSNENLDFSISNSSSINNNNNSSRIIDGWCLIFSKIKYNNKSKEFYYHLFNNYNNHIINYDQFIYSAIYYNNLNAIEFIFNNQQNQFNQHIQHKKNNQHNQYNQYNQYNIKPNINHFYDSVLYHQLEIIDYLIYYNNNNNNELLESLNINQFYNVLFSLSNDIKFIKVFDYFYSNSNFFDSNPTSTSTSSINNIIVKSHTNYFIQLLNNIQLNKINLNQFIDLYNYYIKYQYHFYIISSSSSSQSKSLLLPRTIVEIRLYKESFTQEQLKLKLSSPLLYNNNLIRCYIKSAITTLCSINNNNHNLINQKFQLYNNCNIQQQ